MSAKTGIVVPTLGTRPKFLEQALISITESGDCFVLVVTPTGTNLSGFMEAGLIDQVVPDPGQGLAAAINLGIEKLPKEIQFVNWLGDDDLLTADSVRRCETELEQDPKAIFVFGGCEYIDENGDFLWLNTSGSWATSLLRFGPDLIPQPGALIRREVFVAVRGLNTSYKLAFDLDMFIKLTKLGPAKYLNQTLAKFRWHQTSLSVAERRQGVEEASLVRVSHLPAWLRPFSRIWEIPVRSLTLRAARFVKRKAKGK